MSWVCRSLEYIGLLNVSVSWMCRSLERVGLSCMSTSLAYPSLTHTTPSSMYASLAYVSFSYSCISPLIYHPLVCFPLVCILPVGVYAPFRKLYFLLLSGLLVLIYLPSSLLSVYRPLDMVGLLKKVSFVLPALLRGSRFCLCVSSC